MNIFHWARLPAFLFSLIIASAPLTARAEAGDELMRSKMLADIDTMHNLFSARYAPVEWKQHFASWTLEEATKRAQERVTTVRKPTTKEFHRILRDFCHSMKDYHVAIKFHSTEEAHLPFDVMSAEGRYFISHIDHSAVSSSEFPFQIGDEIFYFDRLPIKKLVDELNMAEERGATTETDQRLAEMTLTHRFGTKGHIVPSGRIIVTGRDSYGKMHAAKLEWSYSPERVNTHYTHLEDPISRVTMAQMLNGEPEKSQLSHQLSALIEMTTPEVTFFQDLGPQSFQSAHSIGNREGFLPELGRIVWQSSDEDPFYAYICITPEGQRVGYVRIPTYHTGDTGEPEAFRTLIGQFEAQTDLLVFDQMNNGGGYPIYGYALLSMLTNEPLSTPKNRMKLTQEDIISFLYISDLLSLINSDKDAKEVFGETYLGIPVNCQLVEQFKSFLDTMIDEWNAGKSMTNPVHLMFVDEINPHPTHRYSKPVLCLINEKDFSAADMIPAVLQDTGRAVLMGTRTAGAGGAVKASQPTLFFGAALVSHTISILERTDGFRPIENLGVEPDVPYTLTVEDLQNNFAPFVSAIQEQIDTMLDQESVQK
ncbi:Uncharacterized protein TC_0248 [Chlamydiales bacterium SCGC AG-110-P3]|nr:Uncharacterized protein TC_0248 [Chlamydiales bacterium SCGC AG-110-P3]